MKGIINKGIQEFIESTHGEAVWNAVKERAGCEEVPFFAVGQDYPDAMSVALIQAAAETLGVPVETAMLECGKFMVPNTVKRNYPSYIALAGSSAREFLLNMTRIHRQVTRSIANAAPPNFEYEELEDGRLIMHYQSERRLCAVLHGLILGVGVLFGEDLEVEEVNCVLRGDARCSMAVTFP